MNPLQTGFVPGRFIGDNGFALSIIMNQAKIVYSNSTIGLLLNQEKAYDRACKFDISWRSIERLWFPKYLHTNVSLV